MSTGPEDEIVTDNPSSDEVSREILGAAGNNPSSEEASSSVSPSKAYELPSDASAAKGNSQSSEDIASEPSLTTELSLTPELVRYLAGNPDLDTPRETLIEIVRNHKYYNISAEELEFFNERLKNPPKASKDVDNIGKNVPQEPAAAAIANPPNEEASPQVEQTTTNSQNVPKRVNLLKRIWLQRDPWIAHFKKYRCCFFVACFFGIAGWFFLGLRFAPLPYPYPLAFEIFGAIILQIRLIAMHIIIPEGPPYLAKKNGEPIFEAEKVKNNIRSKTVARLLLARQ